MEKKFSPDFCLWRKIWKYQISYPLSHWNTFPNLQGLFSSAPIALHCIALHYVVLHCIALAPMSILWLYHFKQLWNLKKRVACWTFSSVEHLIKNTLFKEKTLDNLTFEKYMFENFPFEKISLRNLTFTICTIEKTPLVLSPSLWMHQSFSCIKLLKLKLPALHLCNNVLLSEEITFQWGYFSDFHLSIPRIVLAI